MAEAAGTLKGERARGKPLSRARRWLRPFAIVFLVLAALPLVLAPLYALVNPPVTTVMLLKALGGNGIDKSWTSIDDISPRLVRAVMTSEDQRFCFHHGIDWVEVENALDDDEGRFRGASTITMQTVKNLFLWTGHSWIRKALEAPLALYLELFLSKRRIMEIYLNIVEWDEGVYGAAAAAGHYFHEKPAQLSAMQSALLAAVLPSPATRDAAKPGRGTSRIARRIAGRMAAGQADASCVLR
jgi:monofunctional biosynthetic peptidoglycan transglycosylase